MPRIVVPEPDPPRPRRQLIHVKAAPGGPWDAVRAFTVRGLDSQEMSWST